MRKNTVNGKDRKTGEEYTYYQFRSYNPNTQRYEVVPVDSLPEYIRHCRSEEEAEKYCQLRSSEENAIKARIIKRKEWEGRFQDYKKLLEDFGTYHKNNAPNTWKNDVYHLEAHVFPFFLGNKISSNVQEWPIHFMDFKQWLREQKPLIYNRASYAINTQNQIIKALNLFISYYCKCNPTAQIIQKCEVYSKDMCVKSTADDVLSEDEIIKVWEELKSIRPVSANLFYVLAKTGMRVNEAIGLCLAFLVPGEMTGNKGQSYHRLIANYDLSYHGYICLESQPRLRLVRSEDGRVPRKPLKSRKEIEPQSFRFIPVFDKKAWEVLEKIAGEKYLDYEKKTWGEDPKDYLFFEGITIATFYADLTKAFEKANVRFHSAHKLRHTYLTWLYDVTSNDPTLARIIAGHRDKEIVEIYSHLAEQVGREQLQISSLAKRFKKAG